METTGIRTIERHTLAGDARLDSVVLARLMDEVRNDTDRQPTAYNRMHNRHNR
ncbi:MAG: hypothetical protein JWR80_6002 [Bradyrhizobium sp.]|nr:hypothetical protein [Bradyrhizobium sp.]